MALRALEAARTRRGPRIVSAADLAVGQAARLAAFKEQHRWIQISAPIAPGLSWRASWLTSVRRGGAEEVRGADDNELLDYLEARFD
jgi:hypothetical protein